MLPCSHATKVVTAARLRRSDISAMIEIRIDRRNGAFARVTVGLSLVITPIAQPCLHPYAARPFRSGASRRSCTLPWCFRVPSPFDTRTRQRLRSFPRLCPQHIEAQGSPCPWSCPNRPHVGKGLQPATMLAALPRSADRRYQFSAVLRSAGTPMPL